MAIRILSGFIVPNAGKKNAGDAVVNFNPYHVAVSSDATGSELKAVGPERDFLAGKICKQVSLRHIAFNDQDHSKHSEAVGEDTKIFNLGDEFNGNTSLTINWGTSGKGAEIREISYMIIGEV